MASKTAEGPLLLLLQFQFVKAVVSMVYACVLEGFWEYIIPCIPLVFPAKM